MKIADKIPILAAVTREQDRLRKLITSAKKPTCIETIEPRRAALVDSKKAKVTNT